MFRYVRSDAGHGGRDPGAVNGNYREANIALKIDKAFSDYIDNHGVGVSRSRTKNSYVSLGSRNNRNIEYAAFVSHHLNAASNKAAEGVEVLYNNNNPRSKKLAELILEEINKTGLIKKNRGIKYRNNLAVLRSSKTPSVLIEYGFISNDKEASIINNNIDRLSKAAANGVLRFLNVNIKDDIKDNKKEVFKVESKKFKLDNGKVKKDKNIDTIKHNGVNYVAIRDIVAALGGDVEYNKIDKNIYIKNREIDIETPEGVRDVRALKFMGENYIRLRDLDKYIEVDYNNKTKRPIVKSR